MNPLTGIYGATAALRNALFDRGALASRRLERPVVSVGNLSMGGAGKTPFVIALGELFKARGIRFDVLSRGYGRKTRGVLVVERNGSAADFGDEPLLIARRLGDPVVVGENRYKAGVIAEREFQTQLHILDDGFQHRSLARDFDIVLITEPDFHDRLLPLGRLREPLTALARADAILLPAEVMADHSVLRAKTLWRIKREIAFPGVPSVPLVFCGIARPEQFFAQVRAAGVSPVAEVEFCDHHAYSRRDVEHLLATCIKLAGTGFVTTEKDAINLGPLQAELKPLTIATLKVTLDNPASVVDTILARIGDSRLRS